MHLIDLGIRTPALHGSVHSMCDLEQSLQRFAAIIYVDFAVVCFLYKTKIYLLF